ncbi:hypothetical protein J4479_01485 [Candidatus Woesearchaeota archaeon]|nr:hypothetical protein [Candidatus Woesearchaeota archaeon]
MLKLYLRSFRWHQDLWKPFLIEMVALPIIIFIWLGLSQLLTKIAYSLSQGRPVDQLKAALLSSPETAQAFVASTKYFIAAFIGGTLSAIILTIFLFSLSQSLIWSVKSSKLKLLKWVNLHLALIGILILYAFLYLGFNLLFNIITASSIAKSLLNGLLLIVFLFFLFTAYHSFSRILKVGESITYTFKIIKQKFKRYLFAFLMVFVTGVILSLIVSVLKKQFYWQIIGWPKWLSLSLGLALFLAYLAWMRFYVSRI